MRRATAEHLVKQSSQAPPINALVVANTLNNFRGEVLGCTTEGVGFFSFFLGFDTLLGEAEICNFEVAITVEQNILRLKIAINDSILVKAADSKHNLGSVKAGTFLSKLGVLAQVSEQFSAIAEVHNEV
jgi:hypothetical protein